MSWSQHPPFFSMVTDLLALKYRAERLALAQKIDAAQARAKAMGTYLPGLDELKKGLAKQQVVFKEEPFMSLDPAPKPYIGQELRNIRVVTRKGSIF